MDNKKKVATVAAVVLALVIAITGTFAWQSFGERAINALDAEPGPAGGRLHDDFEVIASEALLDGITINKDIYVENYETDGLNEAGEADTTEPGRDIFVRVKLYEYMETGEGAREMPYLEDGITPNPAYATRDITPLIAETNRDNPETWTPRLFGADISSDKFKSKFSFTYGGQKTYMPTFNKDNHSDETDIKGAATDPTPLQAGEQANETKLGGAYAYAYPENTGEADAGTHDYFEGVTTWESTEKTWDETLNAGSGDHVMGTSVVEHTSKQTTAGSVITMEQWKTTPYSSQPGDFWVIDTDGWAYWAFPLPPESATGLLLDNITLLGEPDERWYYAIYVKSEMATSSDWMSTSEGQGFYADPNEAPSESAENLLNIITGHNPDVVGIYLNQNIAAVNVDGTLSLSAQVITENTNDEAWQEISWSITPAAGSRFTSGIFKPTATDADKWYTVRATSVKDPNVYAECKVYVPKTNQGVLVGEDGFVYLYFIGNDDNTYQRVNADGTLGHLVCPIEVGKPGFATDRTNVVTIGGIHYLDEGDNRHYYAAGPDGKLGTADDVLMYDSGGTLLPSEDTVRLAVTPTNPIVIPGDTLNLTATATFEGNAVDVSTVTWSLVSTGHASGTKLEASAGTATLTADANEIAATITVRVTHPGDANMQGTSRDVTVTVGEPTLEVATTRYIPAANAGDTSDWIEIATYGGYSLVIRKDNVPGTVESSARNYIGSPQQSAVNTWFNGTSTMATNAPLRSYATQNDALSNLGTFGITDTGFSKPIFGTAGATGNDVAFVGSHAEYATLCSLRTVLPDISIVASSAQAQANFNSLNWNHSTRELGRTPYNHGAGSTCCALISPTFSAPTVRGAIGGVNETTPGPYPTRPLLWVDSQAGASMFENR